MSKQGASQAPPRRHGKPKEGGTRKDAGAKIVVRITAEERAKLLDAAQDNPISDYVRKKLFGVHDGRTDAGDRTRDVFRKVAALHLLARRVQRLIDENVAEDAAEAVLDEVRRAIERFAEIDSDPAEDDGA